MNNSKELSVLFIGHSYVRRARLYRQRKNLPVDNIQIEGINLKFKYFWRGASNYQHFNDIPYIKKFLITQSPDIIIIALAGNAVSSPSSYTMPKAQDEMRKFHRWLTSTFPNAKILPIEAEPRFNSHEELTITHDPLVESYHSRRKCMNHAIDRMKGKHGMIRVYTLLNDRSLFERDLVHLNKDGYKIYWELITNCLKFSLKKWGHITP